MAGELPVGTPAAARTRLRIRVARSIAEVGPAAWASLTGTAPVFYLYDFLRSIEERPLTAGSQAYYLLGEDLPGRLVAALPLYLSQTRDPFAASPFAPVTRILASHLWHCYDTVLPARVRLDAWLVEQFWATLVKLAGDLGADSCGLVNIGLHDPLAAALREIGIPVEETAPRYRLRRAGGPATVEEHLGGIGRASRRSLRQYLRRALDAGARITIAPAIDDAVLELCLATADKHAPGYYPPGELAALTTALGPACRIVRVELHGVLLAASICLLDQDRAHFWAGGCRYPAEINWSPQYVLFGAELEHGFASGKPMLEFGRRNDEFKRRYGLQPHRLGRAVQ